MAIRYRRDEEMIADALKATRRGVRDVQRPTGTEKRRTADVADAALDLAETVAGAPALSGLVPVAPTGVAVSSNTGAWTGAGPVATASVAWAAVTVSTDSEPVTVAEYEVLVSGAPVQRVPGLSASLTIPSGQAAAVRVVAISVAGVRSDPSAEVNVTGASPDVVSRAPTVPALSTGAGVVVARWDGTYTGGGIAGAHTVTVERQDGASWVREGAALTGAGSVTIRGTVGTDMTVRFRAYDQLGQETGVSAERTILVASLKRPDIDPEVLSEITPAVLRIDSSRGTAFKNNSISTTLTVTVFSGATQITDHAALQETFGPSSFLEWWWRRLDDSDFGVISSADPRLSQAGFAFTISPADVDEQTVFQCILHT